MRVKAALLGLFFAGMLVAGAAKAELVDYTFTLTKSLMKEPFMAGAETFGGGLTPLVFQFRIESDSPNLYGSSINGLYDYSAATGQLSAGSGITKLAGTAIQIFNQPTYDVFNVWVGGTQDTLFQGRYLYQGFLQVFGSQLMLNDSSLPIDTGNFTINTGFLMRLTFYPKQSDLEYSTGGLVAFNSGNLSQNDFSVTRTVVSSVPESSTLALLLPGLALVGAGASRRKRMTAS